MRDMGVDIDLLQAESIKTFFFMVVVASDVLLPLLDFLDLFGRAIWRACRLHHTRKQVLGRTGGFYPGEFVSITETRESLSPPTLEFRG